MYKVKLLCIIQPVCLPFRSPCILGSKLELRGIDVVGAFLKNLFLSYNCTSALNTLWISLDVKPCLMDILPIKTLKFPSLWSRRIYHLNGLYQWSHQISPTLKDIPAQEQGYMESSILSQGWLFMRICQCGHFPLHVGKAVISKRKWRMPKEELDKKINPGHIYYSYFSLYYM